MFEMFLYLGLSYTHSQDLKIGTPPVGLSVSYDRVLQVKKDSVCQDFNSKGMVCPSLLRKGVFTVAALDNIDHNPSSTIDHFMEQVLLIFIFSKIHIIIIRYQFV